MTIMTPSTQENLFQESIGCSEKIYRLSVAWFYIIGGVSLLVSILSTNPPDAILPFTLISNQVILALTKADYQIMVDSINVAFIIGKIISVIFSLQFICFGYFGYKKRISAVLIGTSLFLLDCVTGSLMGAPIYALVNSPALLGLIIGLVILIGQRISRSQIQPPQLTKPDLLIDKLLWVFVVISSIFLAGFIFVSFLSFLVHRGIL